MTTDLEGISVAITGAARGIGRATAEALIAAGAHVVIGDVDDVALDATATEIHPAGSTALDVRDEGSWTAFLDYAEANTGPLDVLINNAGIMPVGCLVKETDASTRRMLDINLYGVITGSKLAAQRMAARGSGHIVNIASLAGEVPTPGLATYCATKAGVLAFTHSARLEFREMGIRFSAIAPSFTNTELTAGTSGVRGMRNAEPTEIAAAVVGVLRRPRPVVRRTRTMGALVGMQRLLPRTTNEAIARWFGADEVFLGDVDQGARARYEARARGTAVHEPEEDPR